MTKQPWALVVGAGSAFGEATALELARAGMNVFAVDPFGHSGIDEKIRAIRREAQHFHDEGRDQIVEAMRLRLAAPPQGTLRVLLYTFDAVTLPPLSGAEQVVSRQQLEGAIEEGAHGVVYWVQDCLRAGLFDWGGRILALAPSNGPAAALLAAYIRQLAVELAPAGIAANTIVAGVLESGGRDDANKAARLRNPHRRLTVADDVARCIAALCHPATYWLTGNTLHVDGGENIVG